MPDVYIFEPADACVMCGSTDQRPLGRRLNGHQGLRPRRVVGITTTVVRCCSCGLIYSNPRPVPQTIGQHYDRSPEEYWQPRYFEYDEGAFRYDADHFQHLWKGTHTPRALDVGAGVGNSMRALERRGFDAFGVEPSPAFRDRGIANGIDRERLQLAAVEDAEYAPNSFDFVIFSAVLEHLHDPAVALARAFGWLAPGGLILIEVPSAKWLLARLLNLANRARRLDYVTNLSPMHPPYHLYEFTLDSFAAYKVVEHRVEVCDTFLPGVAGSVARRVMAATGTGMELVVWLAGSHH